MSIVAACPLDEAALVLELVALAEQEVGRVAVSPCPHLAVEEEVPHGEAGREEGRAICAGVGAHLVADEGPGTGAEGRWVGGDLGVSFYTLSLPHFSLKSFA